MCTKAVIAYFKELPHGEQQGLWRRFVRVFFGLLFLVTMTFILVPQCLYGLLQRQIVQPAGEGMWWVLRPYLGKPSTDGKAGVHVTEQELLQNMLQVKVKEQYISMLNAIIIVSGLLTTSTYAAIYTSYAGSPQDPASGCSCSNTTNQEPPSSTAVVRLQGSALTADSMMIFRLVNVVSFLSSVTAIICCTLLILWLNKYAPKDEEAEKKAPRLKLWAASLMYTTHTLSMIAFFTSFVLAVLAVLIASIGFLTQMWSIIVALACVLVTIVVLALSSALSGITETTDWGLTLGT